MSLETALTEGLEKFTASETLKIMAEVRNYIDIKNSMDVLIKFITAVRCIFTSVQIATLKLGNSTNFNVLHACSSVDR